MAVLRPDRRPGRIDEYPACRSRTHLKVERNGREAALGRARRSAVNRAVRLVFVLTAIASAAPEPTHDGIKDFLQELVLRIRSVPEERLDRLLTPTARKT